MIEDYNKLNMKLGMNNSEADELCRSINFKKKVEEIFPILTN